MRALCKAMIPALVLSIAACGAELPADSTSAQSPADGVAQASRSASPQPLTHQPSPYDAEVKVLGEFTDRFGFKRKYVQVTAGLTDAQVIALAHRLHALEPETWFWMLDDDTQAKQMMTTLPNTAQGNYQGYPLKWVEQHTVVHVVLQLVPHAPKRWVLIKGDGESDVIAVLGMDH